MAEADGIGRIADITARMDYGKRSNCYGWQSQLSGVAGPDFVPAAIHSMPVCIPC